MLEASNLAGVAGARITSLAQTYPPWAKKTQPGDPPHVRVEPVWCLYPHENMEYSDFGGHTLTVQAQKKNMSMISHGQKTPLVRVFFTWFHYVRPTCFWLKPYNK